MAGPRASLTDSQRLARDERKGKRIDVALAVLGMARGNLDADVDQWRGRRADIAAGLEEAATELLTRFLRGR